MTALPIRVQLRRTKGWRLPANTVSVARPTKWGNPHVVVFDERRWDGETYDDQGQQVLSGPWLCKMQPDRMSGWWFETRREAVSKAVEMFRWRMTEPCVQSPVKTQLHELRGKNLACWCPTDGPCHADVLLELANAPEQLLPSPTLTIDDHSDPGAWATAIAHTPHLAAQVRAAELDPA